MNILITGGIGFIGTNAALHFSQLGHKLTVIDNFSRSGVQINAEYLTKTNKDVQIIKSDVLDISSYQSQLNQADVIIHLAGQTAVTSSIQDPIHDYENNLHATFLLLEHLRKHKSTALFIYSSTNKVYGSLSQHTYKKDTKLGYINTTSPGGITETEQLNFSTPYGCSKGAADQYVIDYGSTHKLNTIVLRQSCIYGPFQQGVEDQGWVAHFTKQILKNQPISIFGDGYQVRDLLYVKDLVAAYEKAISHQSQLKHRVFNIGGGLTNSHYLLDVIHRIEEITNQKARVSFHPARDGDQLSFISCNDRILEEFEWQPNTTLDIGLKQLILWQQEHIKS